MKIQCYIRNNSKSAIDNLQKGASYQRPFHVFQFIISIYRIYMWKCNSRSKGITSHKQDPLIIISKTFPCIPTYLKFVQPNLEMFCTISRCLPKLKILSLGKDNLEMFPIASWGLTVTLSPPTSAAGDRSPSWP